MNQKIKMTLSGFFLVLALALFTWTGYGIDPVMGRAFGALACFFLFLYVMPRHGLGN